MDILHTGLPVEDILPGPVPRTGLSQVHCIPRGDQNTEDRTHQAWVLPDCSYIPVHIQQEDLEVVPQRMEAPLYQDPQDPGAWPQPYHQGEEPVQEEAKGSAGSG